MSKQAYELCSAQNAQGLRVFLEAHSADIDLYLHEGEVKHAYGIVINVNIMGLAAHHKSCECLQVLLDFGADVNNRDRAKGRTLLMCAAIFGSVECMRLLLEKNADVAVNDNDGSAALIEAVSYDHPDCLQLLIEAKAHVDQADEDGSTGLIWACQEGNLECLRLLVENKADVDCKNDNVMTGVLWACQEKYIECLRLLIENNADVDCKDKDGDTGLILAVNIRDINGDTALSAVFKEKHFNCLMVLLDHGGGGISVSAGTKAQALGYVLKDEEGFSRPEQEATFMLLALGADFDAANQRGAISAKRAQLATSIYGNTHRFIERWYGIASNVLSTRVEVDRRVGLGLNGLYQEPLERVLQYLGLSMDADQAVNSSLDGDDGDMRRVLLPNCAHNANHWFQLYQQRKNEARSLTSSF
jgi:ankyrin repeat protein